MKMEIWLLNSAMFPNCLIFSYVWEIRSLVFGQNHMFRHVWSSVLMILKKLGHFFINKVCKHLVFWWYLRGLKFSFGPKWDVWMCSKFDHLRFGMFEIRFFEVCSTSILYMANTCKYFSTADAYDPQTNCETDHRQQT